jgi:hypothetical protein
VIVSPGRGYAFLHAPKTGGTSMTLALEARAMADDVIVADTPKGRARRGRVEGVRTAGRLWKHSRLSDLSGLLPGAVLDRLVPVTLVRDPWDRAVSLYHWLRARSFDHPAVARAKAHDFRGFVLHPATRAAFAAEPARVFVEGGRPPIYLRLEHLAEDMPPFAALLGFTPEMPHANPSERPRDGRSPHDDATRAAIAECCAEDVARFGYRF